MTSSRFFDLRTGGTLRRWMNTPPTVGSQPPACPLAPQAEPQVEARDKDEATK